MAERDVAPAGRFANRHSGGAGAPPGGTRASCQELADTQLRCTEARRKARPGVGRKTLQDGAPRGGRVAHSFTQTA